MHEDILKKLYETFKLSSRQGSGGMTFKYVPNEDVINRMNSVFSGNWSTEIRDKEVIDDQVVVEVLVSATDPAEGVVYRHTGFGSQQIMRFNSGPNQGKIIDIGNAYKGALAKAIVNACTRWGVGLFKERNPYGADNITMVAETPSEVAIAPILAPSIPVPPPPPATPAVPTTAAPAAPAAPTTAVPVMPMPPTTASPTPSPYTIETTAPPTTAVPTAPMPPTTVSPTPSPYKIETTAPPTVVAPPVIKVPMPPVVEAPAAVETITTFPAPIAPDQPVSANINLTQEVAAEMPKIPAPAIDTVPTTPVLPLANDGGLNDIKISDVQKVALNGILTMNNAEYIPLAEEAFAANKINKPVPEREKLNYEEAVVVIKFGNDKFRKNR